MTKDPEYYSRVVKHKPFEAILNYIYNGQVNVASSDLQIFIETEKYLKINNLE